MSGGAPKKPEPLAEPKSDKIINEAILSPPNQSTKSPREDSFLINQEKQLKNFIEIFKANLADNKTSEAFIKLFESSPNQEIQVDELFDHITLNWKNAKI